MHIGLFGKHWSETGPTMVHRGLARAIAEQGHEVSMIGYGDRTDPPVDNISVYSLGEPAIDSHNSVYSFYKIYKECRSLVQDIDLDVFHSLERYPFEADVRTVQWTFDNYILWRSGWISRPSLRSLVGGGMLNLMSRVGASKADYVVASSPVTKSQMDNLWWLSPDTVIPLGIESDWRKKHIPACKPTRILVVGELTPRKGSKAFFDELSTNSDDYTVLLAGNKNQTPYAKEILKTWECQHRGFVSRTELEQLYESVDIVAIPSNLENFSIVALEAIAKGCIVVITKHCGFAQLEEANSNNGIFVVGSSEKAAEKVEELAKTNEFKPLAENAYRLSAQFTWDKIADQYLDIYKDIIN